VNTKKLISLILSNPTAPFREQLVLNTITTILKKNRIPFFQDKDGNLIAGQPKKSFNKTKIALMAHTDHPGFHISSSGYAKKAMAIWYGGAPYKQMNGAKVRAFNSKNSSISIVGKIKNFDLKANHQNRHKFEIVFSKNTLFNTNYFGAFDFAGVKFSGKKLITRAADDLGGCVISLATLLNLKGKPNKTCAIFTRAEETGFIGCLGMLDSKIIPKNISVISLEASKELEGAKIGKGPVLRLGDRLTLFNTDLNNQMWTLAQEMAKRGFKFQRRIMDGGACEATALGLWGYKTSGLSLPLGNYHNQGPRGPSPEYVSVNDIENAIKFCTKLALSFKKPDKWTLATKKRLTKGYKAAKSLLIYNNS